MTGPAEDWLLQRITLLVPLLLSLSVHEWAHAWCAWRLGDDTAARQGRLTLNPLEHIDPVGTLLLPMLGVPFGWAKPVPIEPLRFRRDVDMRSGLALAAAAGPLSNLCLAALATLVWVGLAALAPGAVRSGGPLAGLLEITVLINVVLALFNAFPIPPLDGSRVMDALATGPLAAAWSRFAALGPIPLVVLVLAPALLGIPLLAGPLSATRAALAGLVAAVSP